MVLHPLILHAIFSPIQDVDCTPFFGCHSFPEILEIRDESVTMWNKHTLKTTFEALNPNVEKYPSNDNEILAHGYQSVNGSDEMPLPVGVLNALLP